MPATVAAIALIFTVLSARAVQNLSQFEESQIKEKGQGQTILLTNLWSQRREMSPLPAIVTPAESVQLLFSDRPEYFRSGDGIALQEAVKPGVVRLYVYHVPEPAKAPKIISAIIENQGSNILHLRFDRYAFPNPGRNYLEIGKQGLMDYFGSTPRSDTRELAPHARMPVDPAMDQSVVMSPQLVHGFYEFEIDQPALVSVFQRSPTQTSTNVPEILRLIPLSEPAGTLTAGAGRGLFLTNNFNVTLPEGFTMDSTNGPVQLLIADGKRVPWIAGRDHISNDAESLDKGNYGVIYHIRLPYRSGDHRGLALLAYNPLGERSGCGQMAMALRVSAGAFPAGVVPVPNDKISLGGRNQFALIQRFPPPPAGVTDTLEIEYSPPGASCLPTPLVFVPYSP